MLSNGTIFFSVSTHHTHVSESILLALDNICQSCLACVCEFNCISYNFMPFGVGFWFTSLFWWCRYLSSSSWCSLVDVVIHSDWRNDVLAWLPECHVRSLSKRIDSLFIWHEGSHAGYLVTQSDMRRSIRKYKPFQYIEIMLARFVTVFHSAMLWSVAAKTLQQMDNRDNKFNSAVNKYVKSNSGYWPEWEMIQLLQAQFYNTYYPSHLISISVIGN